MTLAPAPARPTALLPAWCPPPAPLAAEALGNGRPGRRGSRRVLVLAVGAVVVALGALALVPQLGALGGSVRALGQVSPWWLVPLLAGTALSFPGATLSLLGASPERLAFRPTLAVNLAAAFTGRLAPGGLGSMGTVALFLHRRGLTGLQSTVTVGVDAAAGVLVHVLLLALTAAAMGTAPNLLPDWVGGTGLAWTVLVVGASAGGAVLLVRQAPRRPRWLDTAVATARTTSQSLSGAVRSPRRAAQLLSGSLLVSLSQVAVLALALVAVGGSTPFVTVAFAYLAASALASAAPTPGGLGAMEAALVGALTLLGTAAAPAVAGVLLFRLVTFWLPILPGAVALQQLRRRRLL